MKLMPFLPILCALLVGCGPAQVWYKPGASLALRDSDLLDCQVDALAQAPVATQIRQWPPTYVPARRYCGADGRCVTEGGFFAPGEIYTVDVNAGLRRDLLSRCMARLGYASVDLPKCPAGTATASGSGAEAGPGAATALPDTLPRLTGSSCAWRDADGRWRIAERAP